VRVRGLELSGVASLTEGLSIRASYTHLDSKITKANGPTKGNQLADTPNDILAAWADYTIQNGDFTGLGFGSGVRYTGTSYAANTNTDKIPDYYVVDAALHYDLGGISQTLEGARLQVNADNLLDKKYVSVCSPVGCRWGSGRSVVATLDYKW
jgi:iron complex outermembrane receptor protein